MKLFLTLLFVLGFTLVLGQTATDQNRSFYNNNKTPYPLFAGSFGMNLNYSDSDILVLAQHFDALYGSTNMNKTTADLIRDLNPSFDFISYRGNWTVSRNDMNYVEHGHRSEVLYYRLANLQKDISATDTIIEVTDIFGSIIPSTAHKDSSYGYFDSIFRYVTFVKIDSEYMKICSVNENYITIKRGLDNSVPAKHKAESTVLSPIYGKAPSANSRRMPQFRHDSRSLLRWKYFLRSIIYEYNNLQGGIWIDILIGNLSHYAMSGETVPDERIWDIETNTVYDKIKRAKHAENGIRFIQETFKTVYDKYPVIWGNNMMFPTTTESDRIRMLLKTENKPRPIDGFAMENCFAQYGYGGHSGKEFFYTNYEEWKTVIQSIMFMGELKASARPLIMDGGIDNKKFAQLPKWRRHELFLYSYASYLMAVKVENNGEIFTKLGLCPVVYSEDGNHFFEIDSCFTWPIGKPAVTLNSSEFINYKYKNTKVFYRNFENGLVIVNPSDDSIYTIPLKKLTNKALYNPDNKMQVKVAKLEPKRGLILLYK